MIEGFSKVDTAFGTTKRSEDLASRAALLLKEGSDGLILINGLGVYLNPTKRRRELQSAVDLLTQALEQIDGTAWPTQQDYDAF